MNLRLCLTALSLDGTYHLLPGGHVESRGNKKLDFRMANLAQTRIQCEACRAKTKLFIILRVNMAAV